MDFSETHLAALEWSGTYNNVHAGNVVIFKWMEPEPMANLANLTFTCCRFIEDQGNLITGGHDKLVSYVLLGHSAVQGNYFHFSFQLNNNIARHHRHTT